MLKIGITGQAGFVGTHLFNTLSLDKDKYHPIEFRDAYFESTRVLEDFVSKCDVIVHLAAMNRHNDPEALFKTNIELTEKLISALEKTETTNHVLFSSSIQEDIDNHYGRSKKIGRELLASWAIKNNKNFSGLIIPNVFGPFGHPYYNSVVATFSHQLTHNETPKIDVDGELKLIYVSELVQNIVDRIDQINSIEQQYYVSSVPIPHAKSIKVSEILEKLKHYKTIYFEKGIFPDLSDSFDKNLFNTFVCYFDHKSYFPFILKKHSDNRGSFVETVKLNSGGQVSFSTTVPGITRGNHFHTRKAERFAVIKGQAKIEIRRIGTNQKYTFFLDGENPSYVDMPIWFTHNITNVGERELFTVFWINEEYDPNDPDTYFEVV